MRKYKAKFAVLNPNSTAKRVLAVGLLIVLTLGVTHLPVAIAQERTVFSAWASREPTIDGKIDDGEWASAHKVTFNSKYGESTIYVMNDGRNLYFALKVRDTNLGDVIGQFDQVVIDFHTPDDSLQYGQGDDLIGCAPPRTFDDSNNLGQDRFSVDRQIDGECAVTRIDDYNHFEIKHPFNSGDTQDLALGSGGRTAVRFVIFDDGRVADTFPKTTDARNPNTGTWASIRIASASGIGFSNPLLIGLAAVVVVGWIGWIALMVRQRGKKAERAQQ